MAEYIERETLLERAEYDNNYRLIIPAEAIKDAPAADVAPVMHGRWGSNGIPDSMLSACSVCGFGCGAYSFRYCPNCGAEMDLEESKDE